MSKKLINISIDDVSPHPLSSVAVLDRCHELISKYSDIKFTLFIPISYWRTVGKTATREALRIDKEERFCEVLSGLSEHNFELAYHGFFHGIPGISNNDEFKSMSYDQAIDRMGLMFETTEVAGLRDKFKPIFRPPAWRMSPSAIMAARDLGIKVFALSPDDYAKQTYDEIDTKVDTVYYNSCPPFKPLQLFDKTEIVYHACEWDNNYLDQQKTNELDKFLKNIDNYKFCFMQELV